MGKVVIERYLSTLKGAEESYPFGPEALVFKVMGKMFALVSQHDTPARVTLKCLPENGEILTGQFESISPGYYMNKRHWITISLTGEVPDDLLTDLALGSYNLVVSKLTKADKKQLNES
ncbi:MAG: MmcQ/YjbR family DNA-binding protein [Candidatus Polarisedimenticolaceae bacterium]|nr:MmcQ/YjbR family DNA-binding protein [Candidatus Polarisedimenticolaceae bacterium]